MSEIVEHLKRARTKARNQETYGYLTAAFGGLSVLLALLFGGIIFWLIGAGLLVTGIIMTVAARQRIEDLDTQIIREGGGKAVA